MISDTVMHIINFHMTQPPNNLPNKEYLVFIDDKE